MTYIEGKVLKEYDLIYIQLFVLFVSGLASKIFFYSPKYIHIKILTSRFGTSFSKFQCGWKYFKRTLPSCAAGFSLNIWWGDPLKLSVSIGPRWGWCQLVCQMGGPSSPQWKKNPVEYFQSTSKSYCSYSYFTVATKCLLAINPAEDFLTIKLEHSFVFIFQLQSRWQLLSRLSMLPTNC